MLLNLSDVLKEEGKTERKTAVLEQDSFCSSLGSFVIAKKSPVNLVLTNIGANKARVEGNVQLSLIAACDRCLREVPVQLDIAFDRIVTSPDDAGEEADDLSFMEGYQLNVETLVYNEMLENWPVKILCKEDCKGVCPKCGQDLNVRECGCDTFVPDPRMAAIKDIFECNKEV
ncbi:MAG: DUF177 domain-containing protein [Roseburia sp.]|nr:DUF177 domain-containing protein [Roseburia sp.]